MLYDSISSVIPIFSHEDRKVVAKMMRYQFIDQDNA